MAAFSNETGDFVFSLSDNTALSGISEVSGVGFQSSKLLNGKPRLDFMGGSLTRIQIKGVCYGIEGGSIIDELFDLKDSARPVVYVEAGKNKGQWVIHQVRREAEEIMPNGRSLKTTFMVQIEEFANE
jgi:phage protein U